jgi:CheY-like chemotaxis protein
MSGLVNVRGTVVLVVDDDPDTRTALADVLTDYGYETLTESDGEAALDLLDSLVMCFNELPSVVLVDIMMPQLDGYEFVAAMKSRPDIAEVPVILMSASAPGALPSGTLGFLPKPLYIERLLSTIRSRTATVPAPIN